MSFRDGARLIKHHSVNLFRNLKRIHVLDKDPVSGTGSDAHRQSRRSGKTKRARTGYHEHRDHSHQASGQSVGRIENDPANQGYDRNRDDHRHEDGGDFVNRVLYLGLAALSVLHHPYDRGEHRVLADLLGLYLKRTFLVDGPGEDLVIHRFMVRHRLTGQHRLIHIGLTIKHGSVSRNSIPRLDREDISRTKRNRFRLEAYQLTDRSRGSPLGLFLQHPADKDERHDHRGGLKVKMRSQASRSPDLRKQQIEDTEKIGDQRR